MLLFLDHILYRRAHFICARAVLAISLPAIAYAWLKIRIQMYLDVVIQGEKNINISFLYFIYKENANVFDIWKCQ